MSDTLAMVETPSDPTHARLESLPSESPSTTNHVAPQNHNPSISDPQHDTANPGLDGSTKNETGALPEAARKDSANTADVPKEPVEIRYKVECEDNFGPTWYEAQNDMPFDIEFQGPAPERSDEVNEPSPVFDIITPVQLSSRSYERRRRRDSQNENYSDTDSEDEGWRPRRSLKNSRVYSRGVTRMEIHSPCLLQTIRGVVDYYPTQNLTGDSVTIHEPYWVLVHHYRELEQLHLAMSDDQPGGTHHLNGQDEKTKKRHHLGVLLKFLKSHMEQHINPIERRIKKELPTIKYDDIWYLMKQGEFAYCLWEKVWIGCVIQSVVQEKEQWEVGFWILDHPHSDGIERAREKLHIKSFEGEQAVSSLQIIPRHLLDKLDGGERRKRLQQRGEKVCDILWKRHDYLYHKGTSIDKEEKSYNGPIIAESESHSGDDLPGTDWCFKENSIPSDNDYVRADETGNQQSQSKFATFMRIDPRQDPRSVMTQDHVFLICPSIISFALKTKEWHIYNIENIHEIQPYNQIPDTHIGDENLDIINALSHRQFHSKVSWSADFIKDKGEGVVVLLHGPPGVGKTYTVESTAIATGRPLISLTLVDIGIQEENIETELTRWFDLAHRWQAILLIDEADIFLERRTQADMRRNGVVSAFLRKTEYFGGLLFLTTNRVGHIDEAFLSRVHVVIYLPPLDDEKRKKIWESFFKKLKDERKGKIRATPKARSFVVENAEMLEAKWNGREIRNAFQTAIALAEYEAARSKDHEDGDEILVEPEHFERVMKMSKRFHAYIDDIKRDDEMKRAKLYYGRNDGWEERDTYTKDEGRKLTLPH